jgi:hypothetical protein
MTPRKLRRLLRWWGPFLGAGIRLLELSDDWRHAKVQLRRTCKVLRWFEVDVKTASGQVVAKVRKQVYVRRKRQAAA